MGYPEELHYVFNGLGHYDLELSRKYPSGGWSKWHRFLELAGDKSTDWELWTERTIAPCEVVLDYDEFHCFKCGSLISNQTCPKCGRIHEKEERKELVDLFVMERVMKLKSDGMKYKRFFTGNKGQHIHLIFPDLVSMTPHQRKSFKSKIIKRYGAEMMKATTRVMIMREGAKHRKSGKRKTLIEEVRGYNYPKELRPLTIAEMFSIYTKSL